MRQRARADGRAGRDHRPAGRGRRDARRLPRPARRRRRAAHGGRRPVLRPSGAFYLWVDITRSGRDSRDFAFSLIADRGVAVAPGTAFGAAGEGFVRHLDGVGARVLLEGARRLVAHYAGAG